MNPIEQVVERLALTTSERELVEGTMERAEALAAAAGYCLDDQARLGLGAHLASLHRRLRSGEKVTGVDAALFDEVPLQYRTMARALLQPLYDQAQEQMDPTEVGLVALHFGAARERAEISE